MGGPMSGCPDCALLIAEVDRLKAEARKALDLVREAGDCLLLHSHGATRERLGRASILLMGMGRDHA